MCSPRIQQWCAGQLSGEEVCGKRVLDVGAYDENGSLRSVIEPLDPACYVGVDMRSGPGVDVVCRAELLVERFGMESFDIVVTTSAFEHIRFWRAALSHLKRVCRPGGLILFTAPSRWPFHAFPSDYWRYGVSDIQAIFADFEILSIGELRETWGYTNVMAKLYKPIPFHEVSLDEYPLYSMVTEQRSSEIGWRDYCSVAYLAKATPQMVISRPLMRRMKRYAKRMLIFSRRTVGRAR